MTSIKFTPAPCIAYDSGRMVCIIHEDGSQDGRTVGATTARGQTSTDEDKANAALWAAAPDLYEALSDLLARTARNRWFDGGAGQETAMRQDLLRQVRAALAKARGDLLDGGAK